jgi:hypothetical protein
MPPRCRARIIQHFRTIKEGNLTQAIEASAYLLAYAKDCENGLWMDHFASNYSIWNVGAVVAAKSVSAVQSRFLGLWDVCPKSTYSITLALTELSNFV